MIIVADSQPQIKKLLIRNKLSNFILMWTLRMKRGPRHEAIGGRLCIENHPLGTDRRGEEEEILGTTQNARYYYSCSFA